MSFLEKLKKSIGVEEEEKEKKEEISISRKDNLPEKEGELVIDMYQKGEELVIEAPLGGVDINDIEISLQGDILSIEGERKKEEDPEREYFIQECYWGKFSRKVVLPFEVDFDEARAEFKNGILRIFLPKIQKGPKKKVLKLKS